LICNKKICVVGLGYIGLPTACLLATSGYTVLGVDVNEEVVLKINNGEAHIVEPGLESFLIRAIHAKKFKAYSSVQPADIYIICVPTPIKEGDGIPQPDVSYILNAVSGLASVLKAGDFVILESTSPVGTTEIIKKTLQNAGVDVSTLHFAYCPERVLPGRIMIELVENDRIVGGCSRESARVIASFYREFVRGAVYETDSKTAEMCKLVENSYRDINIAFANELSLICAKEKIDVWNLIELANHHPRVNILRPGVGVGGHCIAVDPWFIVSRDPENARLIKTAREVNLQKTHWVTTQILDAVYEIKSDFLAKGINVAPIVLCLGLSFKPDIDDLRESPAVEVVTSLIESNCNVLVVEPNIDFHEKFKLVELVDGLEKADLIVFLVGHRQFLNIKASAGVRILDFCGILK
jgi:UDP-N-acetyl-D-mannosaminuronic acid dehydrogenase